MKRSRGRGRGRPQGGGGGGHNPNRTFDSSGPEIKIRGSAAHVYEKYLQMARDANSAGDRVMAENYLQHAEHYYRILAANAAAQQQYQQQNAQQPNYHQPNGNGQNGYGQQPNSNAAFSLTEGGMDEGEEAGEAE